jgi:hypothetical protein
MVHRARRAPYNHEVQWQQFNSLVSLTAYELWRTRWATLVPGVILVAYALAEFAASLAVTESAALRVTFYAASVRLGLVAALCLHIIVNTVRDGDDRLLELMLSRPLDRRWWVGAKFAGYALAGLTAASMACLPLFLLCPPRAVLAWGVALACELLLMGAAALTAALSLAQVTFACAAVGGFYLLSRAMQAMRWLSQDALFDLTSPAHRALRAAVEGLSFLVPDLARFTQSSWLIYATPITADLDFVIRETLLYGGVLLVVGMLDFQRRNL